MFAVLCSDDDFGSRRARQCRVLDADNGIARRIRGFFLDDFGVAQFQQQLRSFDTSAG